MFFSHSKREKQASRGRKHLVDLEGTEQIYLVIRDDEHKENSSFDDCVFF